MNSQDIRNLQEAYLDVYENEQLDELSDRKVRAVSNARQKDVDNAFDNLNDSPDSSQKLANSISKLQKNQRLSAKRDKRNEEVDLYDIILSHLLDEGYADTEDSALVIMANMSEDWRESIFEEKKPLPVSRMAKQARRIAFSHGTEVNSDEDSSGNVRHSNPEKALTKMAKIGGKQVRQHIKKGYGQGSKYDPYYQELNSRNPSRNKDN